MAFYDSNKTFISTATVFKNGDVVNSPFFSPSNAAYYRCTICYKENICKIELGNKATDWTPAPEDVAQDVTNKVNAVSAAHGGFTFLDSKSIYTGTLTAGQVNAVAINANSITTGTLNADRINSVDVVAKGLSAQTINANNATISNLECSKCKCKWLFAC